MKLYEALEKDSNNRTRVFNYYSECTHCKKPYKKQKNNAEGKPQEFYCSTLCFNNSKRVTLNCAHCDIEFTRLQSVLNKRTKNHHIHFCSVDCKNKAVLYMEEIRPAHYDSSKDYRIIAFKNFPNMCNRCQYDNIKALEVHHRDRNRSNNELSNLEILCANCHTIEHKNNKLL